MPETTVNRIGKLVVDRDGRIRYATASALAVLGATADRAVGSHLLDLFSAEGSGDHTGGYLAVRDALLSGNAANGRMLELRTRSGEVARLIVDLEPLDAEGDGLRAFSVALGAAGSSRWKEVALFTLLQGNRLLLQARSEQELLQSICDLIVREGAFRLAWAGTTNHLEPTAMTVDVLSGVPGFVSVGTITAADSDPLSWGPTGRAVRTGELQLCRDTQTDPAFVGWRERALACGLHSSVTVPFPIGPDEVGLLGIYAPDRDGFDDLACELLTRLAENLSSGIRALRARAEGELAAQRFAALMRASELLVFTSDATTGEVQLSESMRIFLGSDSFQEEQLDPEEVPDLVETWSNSLATGTESSAEFRVRSASGAWRRMVGTSVPYGGPSAPASGLVSVLTDLTPQLEVQQRVAAAARLDAIASLSAGVAHDVKEMILAMVGSAALLEENPTDETREIIGNLNGAARDATRLLRRLVSLGHDVAPPAAVDLNTVVGEVVSMVRAAVRHDHRIVLEPAPDPARAVIDRLELERAIVNLATNADDAIEGPGTITIAVLSERDGRVGIAVRDTGTGILPEVLPRLWDPFFTTKAPGHGTGLGLSSVRAIVVAAGGEITVDTEVGRGTTFTLLLPAAG